MILANRDELALLEVRDQGKVMFEASKVDVPMAADAFAYHAGWATKVSGKTLPQNPGMLNYTVAEPYGVVGQIIPWNFPMLMTSWKWGPALAAGCTIVMKPAEQTPLTCLRMARLAQKAGIPDGVIDVRRLAAGHLAQGLLGGRVHRGEGPPRVRRHPLAADEEPAGGRLGAAHERFASATGSCSSVRPRPRG